MPTIEELRSFIAACAERMTAIATNLPESRSKFDETEQAEWDQLNGWVDEARSLIDRQEAIQRAADAGQTVPGFHAPNLNTRTSDDPFDVSALRFGATGSEVRGRARTAIEKMPHVDDATRESATRTLERSDNREGAVALRYLLTGSEAYRSGFAKAINGRELELEDGERRALARAASLTDAAGGYAVPFNLDPTVIDTSSGSVNPWRRVARVERGVTDTWNGVSSSGVSFRWATEGSESDDNAPTLAQPTITAHKADGFVPFSFEIEGDWQAMGSEVTRMFDEAKGPFESAVFATGSGTGQPVGLVTALVASSPSVIVASAGANVFAKADVTNLTEQLPPRFRGNASWVANLAILNDIRAFGTTDDAFTVNLTEGGIPALMGRPVLEASDMDGSYGSGENYTLIYGDLRNYVIYDRIGMTVEYVPHLFATANNRPSGQRGLIAWFRVGADSVNDAAFRILNIT
jgi:HK97 family phage major capsid protein